MASNKYNKLAGKNIVIFGGTSGIGFGVAAASLASSATVTISSSSQSRIESSISRLQAEFPDGKISGQVCDLTSPTLEQEIEKVFEKSGKVDHIVFTAGNKLGKTPLQEITREKIIEASQVRFVAPLLVSKIGSRYLNPGPESSIVLTNGAVAEHPYPNWTIIAGFSGGMISMARNLALELKPVRVNVVMPGLVDTEMWETETTPDEREAMFKFMQGKLPTGRIATADDVAEAYIYLMKDRNITGRVITTDSGTSLT